VWTGCITVPIAARRVMSAWPMLTITTRTIEAEGELPYRSEKIDPSHRCSEGVGANQREQLILRHRHIHFQPIAGRAHPHLIERACEIRI